MEGTKTGGRTKGTPNKRTSLVETLLDRMEADPIGHMATLMLDESADRELRFRAAKELAQYVAPKRKAIELTTEESHKGLPVMEVRYVGTNGKHVNGSANGKRGQAGG
jgi:hypothetical protein